MIQKLLDKLPFAKSTWFLYLCFLIRHFLDDDCSQKASSLTYTTLLSLVPIITVMLTLFSMTPALSDIRIQVQEIIYNNLLPSSSQNIQNYLDSFAQKSSNLGLIGLLGIFVTTIMTLLTIENAFNQIWRVSDRSNLLSSVIRYWTMITITPIVLGVAFGASSTISGLSLLNQKVMGYGIDWGVWAQIASFLVMTMGFIGMYWFIPKTQVPLKNAAIAGVMIAILFELLKHIFGTVIGNFTSYEAIYGAFAIIPVFLMWLYLSWNVILLGVEISYTLTIFNGKNTHTRHPLLRLLEMLHFIHQHYQQGHGVSENELRAILGQQERSKWHWYLNKLIQNNLITHTQDGNYVLRMDLESMNVWQFYKKLSYPLPFLEELDKHTDDVWLDRLNNHLQRIEAATKEELNISLAELFKEISIHEPLDDATTPKSHNGATFLNVPNPTFKSKFLHWVKTAQHWRKNPK